MRKDHLKRHYQTHIEELTHLQEFTKKQEERIRKIQEIARENNLTIPKKITSNEREYIAQINDDNRKECLQNRQLYLKKISKLISKSKNLLQKSAIMFLQNA